MYLCWLWPEDEHPRSSGAGVRPLIDELAKYGWTLTHDYDGRMEDSFTLWRASKEDE